MLRLSRPPGATYPAAEHILFLFVPSSEQKLGEQAFLQWTDMSSPEVGSSVAIVGGGTAVCAGTSVVTDGFTAPGSAMRG